MKKIYTLISALFFLIGMTVNAQVTDNVSVGSSYSKQAYYNVSTGEVTQISNTDWDIAFSNLGETDGAIFINESAILSGTPLEIYEPTNYIWEDPIEFDPNLHNEDSRLFNPEESWEEGAFNTIRDPEDPNDYGWGYLNTNNNTVEGLLIFVIKNRDGSFLKIQVNELVNGDYTFRYADLDGSNENTVTLSKADAGDSPFIYFSFDSGSTIDVPSNYDLIFMRYTTPLDDGNGNIIYQPVTGVLLGPGTEGVAARGIDPATVDEANYADQYTATPSTIGYEWKFFSFETGWNIIGDEAYFIKTKSGEKYKIVFMDFGGSTTGITTLEKTYLGMVSVKAIYKEEDQFIIAPNPCSNVIHFQNIPVAGLPLKIHNQTGSMVFSGTIDNRTFNIPEDWVSGNYFVTFNHQNKIITKRFQVIK
jgi:hypothetical protein